MDMFLDYVFLPALASLSIVMMWLTVTRPVNKLPTWKPSRTRLFGVPTDASWAEKLRIGVRLQAVMLILLVAGVTITLDFEQPLLTFLLVMLAVSYLIGLIRCQMAHTQEVVATNSGSRKGEQD